MHSLRALAAVNFLLAAVETAFGPFLGLGLTQQGWTQAEIGYLLSAGTVAAILCQLPGGALVDAIHRKRLALSAGLALTGITALLLGSLSSSIPVVAAQVLHAAAAAVLTPAIAAVTLAASGHGAFGNLLGSNTRWASLGSAAAAILLGVLASSVSPGAGFLLTALLCVPAVMVAWTIKPTAATETAEPDHPALLHPAERRRRGHRFWAIYKELNLHGFAVCILLFQAANAAMMPVAVNALAARAVSAGFAVSAAILVSQGVVAALSPWLGAKAEQIGRRPILLAGFAAMPVRGLLMALFPGAVPLVAFQVLDGVSGAALGIMVPLVAADLTRRSGFMNLAIGSLGLAAGIGATISTTLGGWVASHAGASTALVMLAAIGIAATALLWFVMPETRPARTAAPVPVGASH